MAEKSVTKSQWQAFLRNDRWLSHLYKRCGTGTAEYIGFAYETFSKTRQEKAANAPQQEKPTQLDFFSSQDKSDV